MAKRQADSEVVEAPLRRSTRQKASATVASVSTKSPPPKQQSERVGGPTDAPTDKSVSKTASNKVDLAHEHSPYIQLSSIAKNSSGTTEEEAESNQADAAASPAGRGREIN